MQIIGRHMADVGQLCHAPVCVQQGSDAAGPWDAPSVLREEGAPPSPKATPAGRRWTGGACGHRPPRGCGPGGSPGASGSACRPVHGAGRPVRCVGDGTAQSGGRGTHTIRFTQNSGSERSGKHRSFPPKSFPHYLAVHLSGRPWAKGEVTRRQQKPLKVPIVHAKHSAEQSGKQRHKRHICKLAAVWHEKIWDKMKIIIPKKSKISFKVFIIFKLEIPPTLLHFPSPNCFVQASGQRTFQSTCRK